MSSISYYLRQAYVLLFARKAFYKANLLLYKLSMRGMGILNYENEIVSGERAFIKFLQKQHRLDKGVIMDVGANIGNYAVMLRNKNIQLPILAFEPHPVSYAKLLATADKYHFQPIPVGLSAEVSTATIYDHADNSGSEHASMYREVLSELHHSPPAGVDIQLSTIDDIVSEYNITHIALLKIDTEGNELNVLKGATSTLRRDMIDCIQVEFNEMNVISRTFFRDLIDILPGFDFYRLLPDGLHPLGPYKAAVYEIFAFQNVIALRRNPHQ
ncbi:MAG TPA: FkbM family methyltransferase [Chitinophaga sp.]|uniref:FkbM family methyltransferase n=1 Tax=Chitinophaga sp. TaxID=1869181 RepID=UPI002B6A0933|nr:FkbM family methyltransferase [Chitinophaga sp.]HVI44782.1 FkbM family methyltransferase [Chitinophaga sp.]